MSTVGRHVVDPDLALITLRKAAVMAHWIPGLGVRLQQGDHVMRVAAWQRDPSTPGQQISPCEFRRIIVGLCAADDVGLDAIFETGVPLVLDWFTQNRTELSPLGLVRHRLACGYEVIAFPTLLAADAIDDHVHRSPTTTTEFEVHVEHTRDDEVGVSLVHLTYPPDEHTRRHAAALVDEMYARCTAHEVVAHAEGRHDTHN